MDVFSRLCHLSICKDKRPTTILSHFRQALPFFYIHKPKKKYSLLAVDRGSEYMGEFKRALSEEFGIKIYHTSVGMYSLSLSENILSPKTKTPPSFYPKGQCLRYQFASASYFWQNVSTLDSWPLSKSTNLTYSLN